MKINLGQFRRFEKQIVLKKIGINGQKKIFESKVLLIGVGGLGCPLLTYLAASGVGTLGIVDHDKVELSNLNRQTLFVASDVGKFKVIQAKNHINKINKKSKFNGHLFKFNFKKKGCCYRCFMPDKPSTENNCDAEGIFSPVAGILGSLQANEVLKTILNFKEDLNNQMIIFNAIKSNFKSIKLSRNPYCRNKC